MYVRTYMRVYIYIHIYMYTHTHTHTCIYMYVYIYIHIHTASQYIYVCTDPIYSYLNVHPNLKTYSRNVTLSAWQSATELIYMYIIHTSIVM